MVKKNRKVVWSPAAEDDFLSILNYLQNKWSSRVISKFINKIDDDVRLIKEDPKIFPIINTELQIRKSVVTNQNTLYYREVLSGVEIVRLFDSRQDPNKLEF